MEKEKCAAERAFLAGEVVEEQQVSPVQYIIRCALVFLSDYFSEVTIPTRMA